MDEIARLGLRVDADGFVRANQEMSKFNTNAATAEKRTQQVTKEMDGMAKVARVTAGVLGTMLAGFSAREVIQYVDAWKSVTNQLALVTDSAQQLERVQQGVVDVAKRSNADLGSTASLYSTLARYSGDLVNSDEELLRITETLGKSFAVSGASAESQAGAIRQLSQALASGALRGDEFNSVNENAPRIMDAVARSLNMTKGELREFAAEGGITSEIIINAVRDMAGEIDADFAKMDKTFAMYVQNAKTNATEFLGQNEAMKTATTAAGEAILALSENLDVLIKAGEAAAVLMGARLAVGVGKATAAMIANISATATATTTTNIWGQRVVTATAAQNLMTASVGKLNSVMAIFGGPAGLTLAAAGALVMLVSGMEDAAERAARLRGEIDDLTASQIRNNMAIAESEAAAIRSAIARAEATRKRSAADERAYQIQIRRLDEVNRRLRDYQSALVAAEEAEFQQWIDDMTEGYSDFSDAALNVSNKTEEVTDKVRDQIVELAHEQSMLAMTSREAAVFEAVWKAYNSGAGPESIRLIAAQAAALFDQAAAQEAAADAAEESEKRINAAAKSVADAQKKAADQMAKDAERAAQQAEQDWLVFRDSVSDYFFEIAANGKSATDLLEGYFKAAITRMVGDLLSSGLLTLMGMNPKGAGVGAWLSGAGTAGDILGKLTGIGGASAAGSVALAGGGSAITEAGYLALMQGGGGAAAGAAGGAGVLGSIGAGIKGVGSAVSGAVGAIPGWGWALAGAALIASNLDKSTPSYNAGLLLTDLPGVPADRKQDIPAFASGIDPVLFNRRSSWAEAKQVADIFRQADQATMDVFEAAGLGFKLSGPGIPGYAETGLGDGQFYGAAGEEGRPGTAVERQVDRYVRELIKAGMARGKLSQAAYAEISSAGNAEAMIASLRDHLEPDGSHRAGLDYVPFDGYRAELHHKERVLSAPDAASMDQIGADLSRLVGALERGPMSVDASSLNDAADALMEAARQLRRARGAEVTG